MFIKDKLTVKELIEILSCYEDNDIAFISADCDYEGDNLTGSLNIRTNHGFDTIMEI